MKKMEPHGHVLDDVVNELLDAKKRGEEVYCDFNGHRLYSNTVTMDSAFKEVCGMTKEELEKAKEKMIKDHNEFEKECRKREKHYKQLLDESRIPGEVVKITMPLVIEGLKFIAENQTLNQEELVKGLLEIGCNFTLEEVKNQAPLDNKDSLFEGMKKGNLSAGAGVIANTRDSIMSRSFCKEHFLDYDDDVSIYHFIRLVTNDENYTKEMIDNMQKGKKKRL